MKVEKIEIIMDSKSEKISNIDSIIYEVVL